MPASSARIYCDHHGHHTHRWNFSVATGVLLILTLFADRAPMDAQLGSNLAQGLALGVQVGCTLNVHGDKVTVAQAAGP